MKKIFAAMTAALMMVALVSSMAFASSGKSTKFTATYQSQPSVSPAGHISTWTCSGTHVANKTFKDSETCVISGDTTGFVAGTYTGTSANGGVGTLPPYDSIVWNSDSPLESGAQATSWTITIVDNLDGTFTATIVAYYSS
jgi:hypothetical protein